MSSRKITFALLVYYLIVLSWIILLKGALSPDQLPHLQNINLTPFASSATVNGSLDASEITQNLIAFIPFGIFIHILLENKPFALKLVPIVFTSLIYEVTQYIFALGATDITDLITNSLGGLLGILIAYGLSRILKKSWVIILNAICLLGALLLSVLIGLLIFSNM